MTPGITKEIVWFGAEPAQAVIGGSAPNQTISFVIPRGLKGDTGDKGDQGPKGDPGAGNVNSVNGILGPDIILDIPTEYSDLTGMVPLAALPAINEFDAYPVSSESEMLALSQAGPGDFAVRSDSGIKYVLGDTPASDINNWIALSSPDLVTSVAGKIGAVTLNKSDVGLANVDNTSDLNKPISTAVQTALDLKANNAGTVFVGSTQTITGPKTFSTIITAAAGVLVNNASAAAPAFTTRSAGTKYVLFNSISSSTVDHAIGVETNNTWYSVPDSTKGYKWYAGTTSVMNLSGTGVLTATSFAGSGASLTGLTKAQVGLSNVDNTSDVSKPISTATQSALDGKANSSHTHDTAAITTGTFALARIPTGTTSSTVALGNHLHTGVYEPAVAAGTTSQFYRGDKTWASISGAAVDLSSDQTIAGVKTFSGQVRAAAVYDEDNRVFSLTNKPSAGDVIGLVDYFNSKAGLESENTFIYMNTFRRDSTSQNAWDGSVTIRNDTGKPRMRFLRENVAGGQITMTDDGVFEFRSDDALGILSIRAGSAYFSGEVTGLVASPVAGNLAGLSPNGSLYDSGISASTLNAQVSDLYDSFNRLNASNLTLGTVPQDRMVHNVQRFVFSSASAARPTGSTYVEWVGPVQPTNAIDGDTWVNTA